MPNEKLSYQNVNQGLLREGQFYILDEDTDYMAQQGDNNALGSDEFIFLSGPIPTARSDSADGKVFKNHQLKFHIGLSESDRERYALGWNLTKDILIREKVCSFKVAHERVRMSGDGGGQRGKDITIYVKANFEKTLPQWVAILGEIAQSLSDHKVHDVYETTRIGRRACCSIKGNSHISYRYEKGEPKIDLLRNVEINVRGQHPPKEWRSPNPQSESISQAQKRPRQ